MVEYLKAEYRILRDKLPKRLTVTPRERSRLVKLGSRLGSAIKNLITIVTPRAFCRSVAADWGGEYLQEVDPQTGSRAYPRGYSEAGAPLANDNGWGYARVLSELKKFGIRSVSKTTVAKILRDAGRLTECVEVSPFPVGR
jgi:putative transposase